MSLTFHQTFPLDCENLAKLLPAVAENPHISNTEIAEATGIGIGKNDRKGKVQPTIEYAVHSGLLAFVSEQGGRRFVLTKVGGLVLEKDKWLKKPATQWVLHYHLSRQGSEAEAWTFFVHEFLPHNVEFERVTLERALGQRFPAVKVKSINPGVLLTSYTDSNALGRMRIIKDLPKRKYLRAQSYVPNIYTFAYILAELWEAKHTGRMMIDPTTLNEPGHLATTMNMGEPEIQQSLNEMTSIGIIGQMREAPPYQISRHWDDKFDLLLKSYEEG